MISITKRGETSEAAQYALNIQCSWRITKDGNILTASQDLYSPHSEWDGDYEDFDWDVQGSSRFDERIKFFMNETEHIVVESVDADETGGLKVYLSENYILEVFPDSSEDDEYSEFWRLFNRNGHHPHFIVSGRGVERV